MLPVAFLYQIQAAKEVTPLAAPLPHALWQDRRFKYLDHLVLLG